MVTILLVVLLFAVVIITHLAVSYLLENNIKLVAIIIAFVGVLISIFIVFLIMNHLVSFMVDQLGFFYRD